MSLILRIKPLQFLRLIQQQCHPVQNKQFSLTATIRSTMGVRRIGVSSEKERALLLKDKIPKEFELIYRAPMANYIRMAKIASTVTASFVALMAGYQIFYESRGGVTISREDNWFGMVSNENDIWYFAAGFIAINLVIRLVVSKYPLRIYKHVEKYIAVYDQQVPFVSAQHHFLRGEVNEVTNVLNPWRDATYRLGKKSSLLFLNYFKTPAEFNRMCGLK